MPEFPADLRVRKRALRIQIKQTLSGLEAARVRSANRAVERLIVATDWWREADWVLAYIAMPGEVETQRIMARARREGKRVAIPRIEGQELCFHAYEGRTQGLLPNSYGVREPDPSWPAVPPEGLVGRRVLVLAPGLGFDRSLRRLGRGKGFYDRFLVRLRAAVPSVRVVGVAFAEQLLETVPADERDQLLDGVVSDREVIR